MIFQLFSLSKNSIFTEKRCDANLIWDSEKKNLIDLKIVGTDFSWVSEPTIKIFSEIREGSVYEA